MSDLNTEEKYLKHLRNLWITRYYTLSPSKKEVLRRLIIATRATCDILKRNTNDNRQ